MKTTWRKSTLVVSITLIAILGLNACTSGPNHKEAACSQTKEVFSALSSSSETAADDLMTANSLLIAGLAVWNEDGGKADETYELISSYAGKLLVFTSTNSPEAARDFIDYSDENKTRIQELCGISSE